jgi:hypothetical protein
MLSFNKKNIVIDNKDYSKMTNEELLQQLRNFHFEHENKKKEVVEKYDELISIEEKYKNVQKILAERMGKDIS